MAAHYDTYDYPSYWEGRDYENNCEEIAISEFLNKIPKVEKILEVGAGYGRLFSIYSFRAKKIILTDPSAKLLKLAKENIKSKKTKFIQSTLANLPDKVKGKSVDLVVMVRVLHHLTDITGSFKTISRFIKPGGYFILEFANKAHFKACIREFVHGEFTFPLDIFSKDIRSKKNIKRGTIPFINYHPGVVEKALTDSDFEIIERRSVSNIRSEFLKRHLPCEFLCAIDKALQIPLVNISFGPSIFILAQKLRDR